MTLQQQLFISNLSRFEQFSYAKNIILCIESNERYTHHKLVKVAHYYIEKEY
jgi:hypothetical protein